MAAVQITRSMLHPRSTIETPETEPLPPYTPRRRDRDSETASITSEAPTYRSEAPAYTPCGYLAETGEQRQGLPSRRYAPGFQGRVHGSIGDIHNHNYNIASWSTIRPGPASRHYENVARRRAEMDGVLAEFLSGLPPLGFPHPTSTPSPDYNGGILDAVADAAPSTYNALEDPALVGEAAANKAKKARLYRENCMRDRKEALGTESKGWDFMVAQMRDWEERKQSWKNFRNDMAGGRRLKLARRVGFR